MKRQDTDKEKIFAKYISDKSLHIGYKINNPIKNGLNILTDIYKSKYTNNQKAHKEMLGIRNAQSSGKCILK